MKKAVIFASYIVIALAVVVTGIPAAHAGCVQGDCRNGPGKYVWPDGSNYAGDFLNGKFHGKGTYSWADGKKYVGRFKNDKRHGVGTYSWPNGASYRGEWENGKKSGYGIYTFPDGNQNIGIWENGSLSQEMEAAEVEKLLATQPSSSTPAASATAGALADEAPPATTPAETGPPAATDQNLDSDLDKQLAALGGAPETDTAEEESIQATEASMAGPDTGQAPFTISVQKLPLVDGRRFEAWDGIPLLATGPIAPIGTCSVKIEEEASDINTGKFVVTLKIANSSACPLDFKGFLQAGEHYTKVVSWSGAEAVAPKGNKEISQAVVLSEDAPRSEIFFKLQGAGCAM